VGSSFRVGRSVWLPCSEVPDRLLAVGADKAIYIEPIKNVQNTNHLIKQTRRESDGEGEI
jgi:hypothetical protein